MPLTLSKLWIYPVKSCRAIAVDSAALDELGLVDDRRFLVTDLNGKAVTQRNHPEMARVETRLDASHLILTHPEVGSIHIDRRHSGAPTTKVEIWGDRDLQAEECDAEASAWFSAALDAPVRLVRIGPAFDRPIPGMADRVAFSDAYPLLVISEASLAHLNDRLIARGEEPVPMERFRPNIVISGAAAHAEDHWQTMHLGEIVLHPATACARCTMITTDQMTGRRSHEPLRTLASYRRDPSKPQQVNFGRNVINTSKHGRIQIGQTLVVT